MAVLLCCTGFSQAQSTNIITTTVTNASGGITTITGPADTVNSLVHVASTNAPWYLALWDGLTGASGTNVDITGQTNWAFIPFFAYDLTDHKAGFGAVVLYSVTPYFWAGLRVEDVNDRQTTAGVQGQLQVTKMVFGVSVTPFVETSVGLGRSSLYGSAGPGALINFHTWIWGSTSQYSLTLGIVGDYEHVIYGDANWNQANGGPLVRFSFP